ncbi:hypothetical protein BGZ54_009171 [Gamsiella multidivaricata]|nr:hypothetical protein BGZ54_009171 [Gamsiella multidivaricata]
MRRRQNEALRSDQDGDGNYTNHQGYRDGQNDNDGDGSGENLPGRGDHSSSNHGHQHGLSGKLKAGVATRRPFLQRLRKAAMPTLFGALIGWYYDAVDVLVYRNDPRIKGTLLTFSLLCLLTMLSIFFYLEFIRPIIRGKRTEYVNWEKELLYPVRIATASLVLGSIGSNIALWPVWHLSTVFVLTVLAVAIVNVLGIFF